MYLPFTLSLYQCENRLFEHNVNIVAVDKMEGLNSCSP